MHTKANGHWPSILIAGFLALGSIQASACDSPANCGGKVVAENTAQDEAPAEPAATKPSRHIRDSRPASRSSTEKQAKSLDSAQRKPGADHKAAAAGGASALSPTVANARAQLADTTPPAPLAGATPENPSAPPARLPEAVVNDAASTSDDATSVVPADELNEVDRAAAPEKPTVILHPVPQTPQVSNATAEDTWNRTSVIGKVFLVFGGLLTLASAARMFIA
jgi:hypothetical protein